VEVWVRIHPDTKGLPPACNVVLCTKPSIPARKQLGKSCRSTTILPFPFAHVIRGMENSNSLGGRKSRGSSIITFGTLH
jgi:hypothetical protein